MYVRQPFKSAGAFALTVAIGYTACTLAFALFPEAAAAFMNALFHGLDFRKLQVSPREFAFGGFAVALVTLTAWAFAAGLVFGWIARRLQRES